MTYKIVVADDEYYIRKKLIKIIDYKLLNLELVGDFENGQEILDYFSCHCADIVLLDIHMPKVSGLKTAKFLYEHFPETKIIILSGFNDFEYAQTTLRYRVFDYLLKPVDAATLNQTLKYCLETIYAENENRNRLSSLSHHERRLALHSVLRGREIFSNIQNKYSEFSNINYSVFYSFFIDQDCTETADSLTSLFRALSIDCEYFIESDHIFYIQFFLKEDITESLCQYHCKKFFRTFPSAFFYYFGETFSIESDWKIYLKTSLQQLNIRYFSESGKLSSSSISYANGKPGLLPDISNIRQSLMRLLNTSNIEEFKNYIENLFSSVALTKSVDVLNLTVMEICSAFSVTSTSRKDCHSLPYNYAQFILAEEYKLSELQNILINYGLDYMRSTNTPPSDIRLSRNITEYMMEHYQEPTLNVSAIAAHFGLTVSYMGSIFKKVNHTSILQFLTILRITEAKNLLKTKQYKVAEVAEMVGYTDVFYFSKRFKLTCGYSPKDFMSLEK